MMPLVKLVLTTWPDERILESGIEGSVVQHIRERWPNLQEVVLPTYGTTVNIDMNRIRDFS